MAVAPAAETANPEKGADLGREAAAVLQAAAVEAVENAGIPSPRNRIPIRGRVVRARAVAVAVAVGRRRGPLPRITRRLPRRIGLEIMMEGIKAAGDGDARGICRGKRIVGRLLFSL